MNKIMSGETSATQNAAFLSALSTKSAIAETTDEIAGCAAAMRDHATRVETGLDLLEIVGTGGDGTHSFNISTTSALVAAAGGAKVAKHGNRAASSRSGTADCLEALGVNINQSPGRCRELLNEVGMCFFFAQKYHTSMKYVGAIRRELGFRTVFNILGPLTNPGSPSYQLFAVCGCGTARFIGFLLGLRSGASKLDIVEDDDRLASRPAGTLIGPSILVIAAGNVDGGALLELHLFDALAEVAEGLDIDVDPAGIVLDVLVVDTFADTEADDIAVLGILEGGTVVEASGDHGIG